MAPKTVLEGTESRMEVQAPGERLQIKNILCPVDFSDFSDRAVHYAVSLARHFGSRLFIQHTVQPPTHLYLEGVQPMAVLGNIQKQFQRSREEIREMLISAQVDSSEVTVLLNDGSATDRILETISKERIDLLVMGTHGRRGFNRLVLGSVAEGMIHQAVCPVLTVSRPKRDFTDPDQGVHLKTILLATDFSSHSDRALAYALKWGSEWGSKVVVFHAVQEAAPAMRGLVDLFPEYNPYFEQQVARAWEKIRHLIPEAAQRWCQVIYEVRHGNPKEEIPGVAEEKEADLIIMGARGMDRSAVPWGSVNEAVGENPQAREALYKSFPPWGSVSSAVVRDGRFPVLVVRELSA